MNELTKPDLTTRQKIRFAYALPAEMLSDFIEARIGLDIKARALDEGHRKKLPTFPLADADGPRGEKTVNAQAVLLEELSAGQRRTFTELVRSTGLTHATVYRALRILLGDFQIVKDDARGSRAAVYYTPKT